MAVPKCKVSKQRRNTRFANWKLSEMNLVECKQCHTLIEPHKVCPNCGYYKGQPVVLKKEEK